jgi:GntR family transcriptional regulator, vanillate catabolism transcriptional regulator
MDLNEQFHNELLRLAKSPMLLRSLSHLMALPFASPSAMVFAIMLPASRERSVIGQEQHRTIIEAIEMRQGARAEAIAREHALFARRNLEAMLHDEKLLSQIPGAPLIEIGSELPELTGAPVV